VSTEKYYFVSGDGLQKLVQAWLAGGRVIGPVERDGVLLFAPVQAADELKLTQGTMPRNSPKEVVLPRWEMLFRYEIRGEDAAPTFQEEDEPPCGVVVGLHPCEARALCLLDGVFSEGAHVDPYYQGRRRRTVVVTVGCGEADSSCFCTSVGGSPSSRDGSDVFLMPLQEGFVMEVVSEAGLQLEGITELAPASKQQVEAARKAGKALEDSMPLFSLEGVEKRLTDSLEDALWEELELRCLGCGVCSYLCPVCHCFDVEDVSFAVQGRGRRIRGWDTCMSRDFALQASGHNPRESIRERLQQRFLHKFVFMKEALGRFGCVGCGRCIRSCPAGIDLREVIHAVQGT
jgi:ferredoxin